MDEILLLDTAERYLRGEMNEQEKIAFEHLRQTNPDIDQLVVEHHFFLEEINRYSNIKAFKNNLHETQAKLEAEGVLKEKELGTGAKVVNLWKRYKRTIAVAASIAGITALSISILVNAITPKHNDPKVQQLVNEVNTIKHNYKVLDNKIDNKIKEGDSKTTVEMRYNGTGFLIDGKGYLVTNAHVIKNSSIIKVQNSKGDEFNASIIRINNEKDIAILKIDDKEFKAVTLPYSIAKSSTDIAEPIFTMGYPRNEIVYGEGYLSAKTGFNGDTLTCQIDVPANPGNSGGPIFNENGEVIGILSTKQLQAEGVVFAIQSKYIFNEMEALKKEDTAYNNVKISTGTNLKGLQKKVQARKVKDYIFMVKGN